MTILDLTVKLGLKKIKSGVKLNQTTNIASFNLYSDRADLGNRC